MNIILSGDLWLSTVIAVLSFYRFVIEQQSVLKNSYKNVHTKKTTNEKMANPDVC